MSEESGISYGGVTCTVSTSFTEFKVTIGEEFERWITSKELTIEGLTVGQLNKAYLHGRLERFINSALEKGTRKMKRSDIREMDTGLFDDIQINNPDRDKAWAAFIKRKDVEAWAVDRDGFPLNGFL